jgi:penicillin-binding protein 1A
VTEDLPPSSTEASTPNEEPAFDPVPTSTDSLRKRVRQRRKETQQGIKTQGAETLNSETQKAKTQSFNKQKPKAQKTKTQKTKTQSRTAGKSASTAENVSRPSSKPPWEKRVGVIGLGMTLLGGGAWLTLDLTLPDTSNLKFATTVRPETMTFKSTDGAVFYQSGPATRNALTIKEIPKRLQQAFLATEDRRFYQHHGIDFQGIGRAIATNILSRGLAEGGSTLTQQLARISFLDQEQSFTRKFREARLAQKIESKLSKNEILERYLNQVYLGSGAYGVGDAAQIYFNKPVQELSLTQMATLAGLPAAPSLYSPLINPKAAQNRRDEVLTRMVRAKYITSAEATQAKQADLALQASPPPNLQDKAPYFSSYLKQQLTKVLPASVLKQGGLTVETTLNLKWQEAATRAVEDTVYVEGYGQGFSQAAMVAIEPKTGEIRSMVGGASFKDSQFNRVTQAQRQPGSTFKAFVYTAAIASGLSPYDGYQDVPFVVDGYKPKNYSSKYHGWVPMTTALTNSFNIPAVRALIDVGFEPTINLAHSMGIQSKLDPYYSTALGGNEVNLLELTSAYGTIAAQGYRATPYGIRRVLDRNGRVIYDSKVNRKSVLDPSSAAIMSWMLQQVVEGGTGTAAQLNRPVAGKTGTSEHARDLWFVGFIPQLVAGVWLGNDDNYQTYGSSTTAAYVWRQYMKRAIEDLPVEKFPELPKLEGRKGSLKAKPVRPGNMYNISLEETKDKDAAEVAAQ